MKKLTKKDIKVGSIWIGRDGHWTVEVTKINKRGVHGAFLSPDRWPDGLWEINEFIEYYEPVYTIEGFEV